ncbi:hypothetical protein IKF04_02020 [Candidatus Saccharibacteria bacterium]|nr:hypothetical protein [Candidatus Saccharibacteria bacterium]
MIACEQHLVLSNMAGGNWKKLADPLEYLAEDAPDSTLSKCGECFARGILGITIKYLKDNQGKSEEELLKFDGVEDIIRTFAYYVDMQTFAAALHTKDLSIRTGRLADVQNCKKGSTKNLSRNEIMAITHGIAKGYVKLKDRTLNAEIVEGLIEKKWFTRLQILQAMANAKMITKAPQRKTFM